MNLQKKNLIVLGHTGMLGQMVVKYFRNQNYQIITTNERFTFNNLETYRKFLHKNNDVPIIINCLGKITQKTPNNEELYTANAFFPLFLANTLHKNQLLIQPSTDCVFSGQKGQPYKTSDTPDPQDDYGLSKLMGETALLSRKNTLIIRVSIIGTDKNPNPKGLLGWFLSNPPETELNGYVNHLWNGITTLEWSKQVENLIKSYKHDSKSKILQLGTKESYSKYEMLMLFQKVYQTNYKINKFFTPQPIDRRLVPDIISVNLEKQLYELKNYG